MEKKMETKSLICPLIKIYALILHICWHKGTFASNELIKPDTESLSHILTIFKSVFLIPVSSGAVSQV